MQGISAAVIYLAVWLIKKFGDISKITTDPYTFVPCGILVGIGVVIFVTTLFGCCGAGSDSKCCLSVVSLSLYLIVFELFLKLIQYTFSDCAFLFNCR